ncbi:MAG TPA: GNAT family N-acetyltransferase [Roseiflexaceae bacterium]|nr:GNAT family N-acetyltransferase [Roseiflexaceae bacterium]
MFSDTPQHILIEQRATILFRLTAAGRMVCVNEPGDPPAPNLYICRSQHGLRCWFHVDLPDALCAEIRAICAAEPPSANLETPPHCRAQLRALLAEPADEWRGPCFTFPAALPPAPDVVLLDAADAERLRPTFGAPPPTYWPIAAIFHGDQAVAICGSSRRTPFACEAGADTLRTARGRGYAVQTVSAWAQAMRAEGCTPLYSTAWDNEASRAVAHKLGLICYAEDWSL